MKIVITGGHHSSALPVIENLRTKYPDIEIHWFGHKYSAASNKNESLEFKEINALGISFYDLKAGKLYKTFNVVRLLRIPCGFFQAFRLLKNIRPDVILSFGGYLAVPTVMAGWFLGVPSITHEQTVVTGYANKLISHFVKKICIGWKDSEKYFPKNKIVYSGVPIRPSVFEIGSDSFTVDNELPTIYVTAGKSGSHMINEAIREALPELLSFTNVIHQCGDHSKFNDFEQLSLMHDEVRSLSSGKYFLRRFVFDDEIGEVFNKSSLVIGRAGAHTVTELLALEKPSILIPIPWVSHNEQFENALLLKKYGLAEILEQKDFSSASLISGIKKVLGSLSTYKINNPEASKLISLNAAGIIADETIKLTKKSC